MSLATTATIAAKPKPAPTRSELETICVDALRRKKAFTPGIHGYERDQQALMIVRVVMDALEGPA